MKRLIGTIAVTVAAGLPACGGGEHAAQPTAHAPIAVTVAPAVALASAERLEAGGVVAARESASISSRIVATVSSVRVKAGDRVRAGAPLVALDARDIAGQAAQSRAIAMSADKALAQARSQQAAAEAEHRLATAWQKRIAALHARHSATDQERDEAEARLAAAAARLSGTQAGIEGAEAQLVSARAAVGIATTTESFATLRAPFDGLVTERLVDPGNLAAPGIPLLRIESAGARQVLARVDEARAGYVHAGDRVRVLIDEDAEEVADDAGIEGVVAEVARAVGADQRAFTVKVSLPGSVTARSGSFARVIFRGAPRRALVIPARAVQRHGQVSSVYVVQNGVARLRIIQLGAPSADGIEVLAGLDAGESIVTSPAGRLTDGAPVTTGAPARTGGGS
ncbi:MAG TPA: efflux RND transporter periplasmic adaptor subunit [Vicinamibacterales bacterium]|nr:efflux RND transporter periplasmic adaptor subunit [Vicinamibacterales bacterium]